MHHILKKQRAIVRVLKHAAYLSYQTIIVPLELIIYKENINGFKTWEKPKKFVTVNVTFLYFNSNV